MYKKKFLCGIMAFLCLVLTSCQTNSESDKDSYAKACLPLISKMKTDYSIVCLLEDDSVVKSFKADLMIKTKVKMPLEKKIGKKSIVIGTVKGLNGKGGTRTDLSYGKYEIKLDNENIYVSMSEEGMAEGILEIFKGYIVKTGKGEYGLDEKAPNVYDVSGITETVPEFETATGKKDLTFDCGSNNYMIRYSTMQNADIFTEIEKYDQKMKDNGFDLFQSNSVGENYFATYIKNDTMVHINFFASMRELRIVFGKKTSMFTNAKVENYEKKVTPSVSIIKGTDNVLCMVIQFADGSFAVLDGGFDTSGEQEKTLNAGQGNEMKIKYYRDVEADMKTLYDFLHDNTPGGEKPQVTWIMSHADPDHILLPTRFFKDYKDKFDLNLLIYNFPNLFNIGLGESSSSTNDPTIMTSYKENYIKSAKKNFPNAKHYICHTGDKVYFPGAEFEILMTPSEDYCPNPMPWMNHTSIVIRATVEGKTIMLCGDAEKRLCQQISGVFGDYIASDILQLSHHGANGATYGFYKLINPTICFWPCQQYHVDYDNRHLGIDPAYDFNKFIRTSEKVIANYSNSETHTVLLPSMIEKK